MTTKIILAMVILLLASGPPSTADDSISAKQFPVSFFFRYRKAPMAEKEKVLRQLDATLSKLNREGLGLIAKGAVIDRLDTNQRVYERLTILDESGLIIIVHQVPNLYYQYSGQAGINPNIYLIIKRARVNFPESYIRYGYVVEGDFAAYANKFVKAILEGLERGTDGTGRQPAPAGR